MTELSCAEFAELISYYLDGELGPATEDAVAAHIGHCADCEYCLNQFRQTIDVLRTTPPEPMPAHLERRLLAAFRQWREGR
jgi:anti-sigma factor RsiW